MFDLKKFLQGAVAQINPWDNGANYNSVVNQTAPPPQPATTARPQQRAAVSTPGQTSQPTQRQRPVKQAQAPVFDTAKIFQDINNAATGAKDFVGKTAGDIGRSIAEPYNYIGQGIAEVANEVTGGAQRERDAQAAADKQDMEIIKSFGERIKNAQSPEEAQRLRDSLTKIANIGNDQAQDFQNRQQEIINRTDPIKGAASIASIGTDVATAGIGTAGVKGVKTALQTGGKVGAAKELAKQAAVTGATAAPSGALAPVVSEGGNAKAEDVLKGAATAALIGGAIPLGAAAVKPVTTKLVSGARQAAPVIADGARAANRAVEQINPAIREMDNTLAQYQRAFDVETNPTRRAQINKGIADLNTQRRAMAQGGYIKVPGVPDDELANIGRSKPVQTNSIDELRARQSSGEDMYGNDLARIRRANLETLANEDLPIVGPNLNRAANDTNVVSPQSSQAPRQLPTEGQAPLRTGLVSQPQAQKVSQSFDDTLPQNNKDFNSNDYIRQQSNLQEQARKSGERSIGNRIRDEVGTKLIDSFSPIERTLRQANKDGAGIKIGDENNITTQIDRALRGDTIASQYVKDKGLAKVIQNVPDTKAFDQYLIARHAKDLEANGVKTGRNLEADARLVDELNPQYEKYAKEVKRYSDELLDQTVSYGLISKELADGLKKKYPNYVPANRIFNEDELTNVGRGGGKASISTQSVVQKIKGSEREIESPLASIANKTQDVIMQGERNKAASILAGYKDLPGNPFNLRELKPGETVGTKSTISYIDNGKVRRFETTPEIEAAAKSLNKEQIGIIGKIVRIPTRALRLGATGINPGFALANVTKDLVSAAVNSKHPLRSSLFNPTIAKKASKAAFNHKSDEYAELVREGAGGTSFDIARDAPRQTVNNIRSERNVPERAAYIATHPGELLRAVEDTIGRSEEFVRALQYYGNKDAALAKNMSNDDAVRYAAHAARTNSVNFARAGEYGAVLNSALPYLNAGIQGARNLNRNIRDRPAETLSKIAVLSTLPVVSTTVWNLSDPKRKEAYDQISDYEKEGNMIIVPPEPVFDESTGKWNVIKIPLSPDLANLSGIARKGIEAANGSGELNAGDVLGKLVGTTTSFDVSSGRSITNKVLPQALKPAVETLTNQNLFSGNKIVPDSQKNLPAAEQYGDYTSGTAKVAGKLTNTSPRVIDNAIKSSTGGAGQNAVNFSDSLLAMFGAIPADQVQGKSIPESIGGRFYGASKKDASDAIEKNFTTARDDLINTEGYKSLPQDEKAKALNRLENDIKAIEYNKEDSSKYEKKDLTKNQAAYASGERKTEDYLKKSDPSHTKKEKTEKYNSDNAAEYNDLKSKYDEKVKKGELSPTQKIKAETALNKAKVGAEFSKSTRDYYGLTKAQLNQLVSTDPDGNRILEDVLKYGDKLVESGINSYNKFRDKKGAVSLAKATKKASGGKKKSGGSKVAKKGKAAKSTKGTSVNYGAMLASTDKIASANQSAIRNLLKGKTIKRKELKA